MDTLRDILVLAKHKRVSVIAQRLSALDPGQHSTLECLEILRWLVVCGRGNEAADLLAHVEGIADSQEAHGWLWAARARLALTAGKESIPLPEATSLPRWVVLYQRSGHDIPYPSTIETLRLVSHEQNSFTVEVSIPCPACGHTLITTPRSNVTPMGKKVALADEERWICPHCLCMRLWDKAHMRKTIFSWYEAYLESLPRTKEGLLSEEDALHAALIASALRPLGLIRFGTPVTERIGHLIINTQIYILEKIAAVNEASLDYICLDSGRRISNAYLVNIFKKILEFRPEAEQIWRMLQGTEHAFVMNKSCENNDLPHRYTASLPLTLKEHMKAREHLEQMNIPAGSKIACLLVRDQAFLESYNPDVPNRDYSNSYRNMDIATCIPAINFLTAAGYYVLRMGSVMREFTWPDNPHFIDYTQKYRSEFMDIWLFSNCDLCVTSSSGPDALALFAQKPVQMINYIPMGYSYSCFENNGVMYKYIYRKSTNTLLSLEELLSSPIPTMVSMADYQAADLQLVPNSAEEIESAVRERLHLLQGGKRSEETEYLQRAFFHMIYKYRAIFVNRVPQSSRNGELLLGPVMRGFTSSVFLERHREELLAFHF